MYGKVGKRKGSCEYVIIKFIRKITTHMSHSIVGLCPDKSPHVALAFGSNLNTEFRFVRFLFHLDNTKSILV